MSLPRVISANRVSLINKALKPFSYGENLGTIIRDAADSVASIAADVAEVTADLAEVSANVTEEKTKIYHVVVPIAAGSTTVRFLKPGAAGAVTEVKRFIDNRPTSAADGITSKLDNGAAVLVAEFDLTASPSAALTETATTLGAGTALTASSVISATVAAGADVVCADGAAITYVIKVVES